MKLPRILLLLGIALGLVTTARAADEDTFLGQIRPPLEQPMGRGHSVIWTLPLVATQYQPSQPDAAMQAALQAQQEGRFLDALILLDEAGKSRQVSADTRVELKLLRASFLLQGGQSAQALEILLPLLAGTPHVADSYALVAMPQLALSYALQGMGHLAQARAAMHGFNTRENNQAPPSAIALAREAELALT